VNDTKYSFLFDLLSNFIKTGEVSVGELRRGRTATTADSKLREATNDTQVTVKVQAMKSSFIKSVHVFVGAFDGSTKNSDGR